MSLVTEFNDYRQRMNEQILAADNKVIKRFFNLDTNTYQAGALDVKIKEMLGLACSMVLRCDDCIKYHLGKCQEEGLNDEEIYEVFAIANLIGGSIVIPHFRRAVEYWEALKLEPGYTAPPAAGIPTPRQAADAAQQRHEQAAHGIASSATSTETTGA